MPCHSRLWVVQCWTTDPVVGLHRIVTVKTNLDSQLCSVWNFWHPWKWEQLRRYDWMDSSSIRISKLWLQLPPGSWRSPGITSHRNLFTWRKQLLWKVDSMPYTTEVPSSLKPRPPSSKSKAFSETGAGNPTSNSYLLSVSLINGYSIVSFLHWILTRNAM